MEIMNIPVWFILATIGLFAYLAGFISGVWNELNGGTA